ncbi:hypothetical protein E2C01_018354 [Portunus trituberculatus]|uniref:Uncharacterized protein n=1 Tax=Portunus trituberculatus TaxID=210409 RepID=A0A5B7DVX1_PORTR|nr:hypothetical protein [Portunus trituberculatus]
MRGEGRRARDSLTLIQAKRTLNCPVVVQGPTASQGPRHLPGLVRCQGEGHNLANYSSPGLEGVGRPHKGPRGVGWAPWCSPQLFPGPSLGPDHTGIMCNTCTTLSPSSQTQTNIITKMY